MKTRFYYCIEFTSFLFQCTRWDLRGGITVGSGRTDRGRKNHMFSVCAHRVEGHTAKRAVANDDDVFVAFAGPSNIIYNEQVHRGFTCFSNSRMRFNFFPSLVYTSFPYLFIYTSFDEYGGFK